MATTTWTQGTITLTNGSATVTGDGTDWDVAELEGGETLAVVTDPPIDFSMTIQAVVGAEEITLTAPWAGATLAGVPYQITRDYTGAPADAPIPQRGDMNPWAIIGEAFRRLNNAIASFSPAWGSITGTLSDQTDLQNALDAKADASSALPSGGTTGQLLAKATNDDFDVEWIDGGALFEEGTGYLRLPGGTQIVWWKESKSSVAITTETGGQYRSDTMSITYPMAFASGPVVIPTATRTSGAAWNIGVVLVGNPGTTTANIRFLANQSNTIDVDVFAIAIGRWHND